MRILIVQTDKMWTSAIDEQEFLQIPDTLDVGKEEQNWFAQGGGALQDFVNHLTAAGAQKIDVEIWTIQYQS